MGRRTRSLVTRRPDSPWWWYDFTIHGRRFRGSCETDARDAAELIAARVRHQALMGAALGQRPRLTLETAFSRYLLEHAASLPSVVNIHWMGRRLLNAIGSGVMLDQIDDAALSTAVAKLRGTKTRRGRQPSPATVNRHLVLLRAVLRMAADRWGAETPRINWKAQMLREPAPRDRWLTRDEVDRLLTAAAPHLRPAILFSLITGVRLANAIGLDWRQVDMQGRTITLRIKSAAPGGDPHVLPITGALLDLLLQLGPKETGPVFTWTPRRKGALPRPIRSWRTAWRGAIRRAKIEDFRWHDLRHTAASWMVQAGVSLELVQRVLGHRSIATTQRYAHHHPEAKAAAMDAASSQIRHALPRIEGQHTARKRKSSRRP